MVDLGCVFVTLLQGLSEVIVANTIPLQPEVADNTTKIKALSVGGLIAEVTAFHIHEHTSPIPIRVPMI